MQPQHHYQLRQGPEEVIFFLLLPAMQLAGLNTGLIPAGAGHMLDDLHLQQDSAHFTFNSE